MCPFCYIGKRKLEKALEQFPHKDSVNIVWHSFQLDPTMEVNPGTDIYSYLSERKGISKERAIQMHKQLTETARLEGLTYNFDQSILANSFDAHRLIQMAKTKELGDAAEERIFKAYFTEGKNISDPETLVQLGTEIGLESGAIKDILNSDAFESDVTNDIEQAQAYGINGVPFFVLNNKYGISGAQPSEVFLNGLTQAWSEHAEEHKVSDMGIASGAACTTDGNCN
jgi:predicted DsbA family dithiol-disulfide isomerase